MGGCGRCTSFAPVGASRHGDNLIKLTRLGSVNAYLVREDDGFTVIDTGLPGTAKAILAAAEETGGQIRRIALTHAHGDHAGSLAALHKGLPGAEVLISSRDARFRRGDKSLDPDEPQAKLRGSYVTVDVEPTRLLEHGDRVGSLGGVRAPGQIAD